MYFHCNDGNGCRVKLNIETKNTRKGCAYIYVSGEGQPNENFYERKIEVYNDGPAQYMLETTSSDTIYVTITSNCGESNNSVEKAVWKNAVDSGSLETQSDVNFIDNGCADETYKFHCDHREDCDLEINHLDVNFAIDGNTKPDCFMYYRSASATSNFYLLNLELISEVRIWPVIKEPFSSVESKVENLFSITVTAYEDSDFIRSQTQATYTNNWSQEDPYQPFIFSFNQSARANYIQIESHAGVIEIAEIEAIRPSQSLTLEQCSVTANFMMIEDETNFSESKIKDKFSTSRPVMMDLSSNGCEIKNQREILITDNYKCNETVGSDMLHIVCPNEKISK